MLHELIEKTIQCPYCGESIEILVDGSIAQQSYIEDCQVCCKPIEIAIDIQGIDDVQINVRNDSE